MHLRHFPDLPLLYAPCILVNTRVDICCTRAFCINVNPGMAQRSSRTTSAAHKYYAANTGRRGTGWLSFDCLLFFSIMSLLVSSALCVYQSPSCGALFRTFDRVATRKQIARRENLRVFSTVCAAFKLEEGTYHSGSSASDRTGVMPQKQARTAVQVSTFDCSIWMVSTT